MRVVVQRVTEASVSIGSEIAGSIGKGLLVLVGIEDADVDADIDWLSGKLVNLRIFNDEQGVMNRSVREINGDILIISQFTLHASTKKGNRPSYIRAAKTDIAIPLYNSLINRLAIDLGKPVKTGQFGAMMRVSLINDGPVTLIIDTRNKE
ncbi:MAG: D-aminoacyl-tRNA deacylase [Bacteroidales bacterium]|jgi:D-tyrosyl-tRNA(Tyr) deacylase|nr:D-aminoacyl-tRNA deacylase [Bacteroidales bacterium]